MKNLRNMMAVLALPVIAATLGTSGVSSAAEAVPAQHSTLSPASATACPPAKGLRIKKASSDRVYLIGPNSRLYYIPSAADYEALWGSWDGIRTVSDGDMECFDPSTSLAGARLVKYPNDATVYIRVTGENVYRPIKDWNTFTNVYHFDPADIKTTNDIGAKGPVWD
ncbi:acid shock protein [Streptomyces caeruleatus]|uniref:Uncharacterized protein n=1 Tax=Streptomyces caeruleatus TaxID=661399 RepID=A0A124I9H7_9ACTN|nr:acid shock protein [Streptomyces caeruleatus]KUO02556.1 hypothetical protein AQJ67_18895 [Streptomyces caeruleatus]